MKNYFIVWLKVPFMKSYVIYFCEKKLICYSGNFSTFIYQIKRIFHAGLVGMWQD